MATLVWDQIEDRFYEAGVDKGVLYKEDGYGVAWNGLTSVEVSDTYDVEPLYYDGVKFNDLVTIGDFAATLRAFTYPEEFLFYEGVVKDQTGFYITSQKPSRFGLSYQTRVGNAIEGINYGYRIHVVYNITATPSQRNYETISADLSPIDFEWNLTAVPEKIENFRPTAHIIFDSNKIEPNLLHDIEDILYGDETNDAFLPSLQSLASFIRKWNRLIITDHGDGTWTAESSVDGVIVMLDSTTFQITEDSAVYIDADSYTISSSEKNEEDIWLP